MKLHDTVCFLFHYICSHYSHVIYAQKLFVISSHCVSIYVLNQAQNMKKKSSLSTARSARMVVLSDEGYPEREIKVKVLCCKDSCSYWYPKYQEHLATTRWTSQKKTVLEMTLQRSTLLHGPQEILIRRYILFCFKMVQMSLLEQLHDF